MDDLEATLLARLMAHVGVIKGNPTVILADWRRCVDASDALVPPLPREVMDAVTQEVMVIREREGAADLVVDGRVVGFVQPDVGVEENGELNIYAPDFEPGEAVVRLASEIAETLNAVLEWYE